MKRHLMNGQQFIFWYLSKKHLSRVLKLNSLGRYHCLTSPICYYNALRNLISIPSITLCQLYVFTFFSHFRETKFPRNLLASRFANVHFTQNARKMRIAKVKSGKTKQRFLLDESFWCIWVVVFTRKDFKNMLATKWYICLLIYWKC